MFYEASFIHTSDLHLNGQEERYNSLSKITVFCIKKKVDALLIAGDLFADSHPSLSVIRFVLEQFKMLNRKNIRVFLIAGNHDANLAKHNFFLKELSDKVIFFDKEGRFFNLGNYSLYGKSYSRNWDKISLKHIKRPLIGLFHGSINEIGIEHFAKKNLNYVALGHFHDCTKVASKPPCYYSGSPVQSLAYKRKSRFVIWVRLLEDKVKPIKIKL